MMIVITVVLVTLIICVTILAKTFLENNDNYSFWRVESDLKEINEKLDKLIKKSS